MVLWRKTGEAVAGVLFGDYNPGGRLPVTFPRSVGQVPMNFPYKPGSQVEGKTYVSGVLYPFGYGLSYTTFEHSRLEIEPKNIDRNGTIEISVGVKNTGRVKGEEVVQLYTNDRVSSVTTHEKELKGFERVTLMSGETKCVAFLLPAGELSLLNGNMERVVEPGEFEVMVGGSSEDIRLRGTFTASGN